MIIIRYIKFIILVIIKIKILLNFKKMVNKIIYINKYKINNEIYKLKSSY